MKKIHIMLLTCCFLSSGHMLAKKKKPTFKKNKIAWNLFKLGAGITVFLDGFTQSNNVMCNIRLTGSNNMSKAIKPLAKDSALAAAYLVAGYLTARNGFKGLRKNWIGL